MYIIILYLRNYYSLFLCVRLGPVSTCSIIIREFCKLALFAYSAYLRLVNSSKCTENRFGDSLEDSRVDPLHGENMLTRDPYITLPVSNVDITRTPVFVS